MTNRDKQLKLFVWTDVLTNWTPGIIFALAENVEQAREVIEKAADWRNVSEIYEKSPEIVTDPKGFTLSGGS